MNTSLKTWSQKSFSMPQKIREILKVLSKYLGTNQSATLRILILQEARKLGLLDETLLTEGGEA